MPWFWWFYSGSACLAAVLVLWGAVFGIRRLADLCDPEWDRAPEKRPRVSVIVPARNEEDDIGACLNSLAEQDYEPLEIIAVNDRSTDATGAIMEQVAALSEGKIRVLHVRELPERWLGKTHAMWSGAQLGTGEWLLFTDGDVVFRPDAMRRALAYVEETGTDHFVLLPSLVTRRWTERISVAIFLIAIVLARPWKMSDPKSRATVGAGAFNMVRRSAYEAIGTFEALRLEIVEDLELALRLKRAGFRAAAARGRGLVSLYWARGLLGLANNLTKNAFAVLNFRWYLAVVLALVVVAYDILPFLLVWLAPPPANWLFGASLALTFAVYVAASRYTGISAGYFVLLPVAGGVMAYAILRSMVVTLRQGGVMWRGTLYPLEVLRKRRASGA